MVSKLIEDIAIQNKRKYLKPPTIQQLVDFIDELGVTGAQFEYFYGIPHNQVTQYKSGAKLIPSKYWHYIYEKIKPAYGVGFIHEINSKGVENVKKRRLPSNLPKGDSGGNHNRLQYLKK